METTPRNIALSRWVAAIMDRLLPPDWREDMPGDVFEVCGPGGRRIPDDAKLILMGVASQVRRTFDIRLVAGEACVLYISFAGASLSLPLVLVLSVALSVLILRDAYSGQGSPLEAAEDAVVAATVVFLSQALFAFVAPWLALPAHTMLSGAGIGLLAVSIWRVLFRRIIRTPQRPRRRSRQAYRNTWAINLLWMAAGQALILTNTDVVRHSLPDSEIRDFFFVLIPMVIFAIAYRLQMQGPVGPQPERAPLFGHERNELARRRDNLWSGGPVEKADAPGSGLLSKTEALFFAMLALPLFLPLVGWVSGYTPSANVDWVRLWGNLAAFLALSVLWIFIRKSNRKAARALQEEIDALDASLKT